ncbi:MAG: indole-3-glycerol phosphate synthase TrpC [Candidatus Goldbacteria bacterium]|nr:indole-3-glycerol phosphate synthase TrpC [Candidatus Goldiibacteriota bacterium]
MNILKKIVKNKKNEIKIKKEKIPVKNLLQEIIKTPSNRNFREIFENNPFVIIAEIKKKSPSAGFIKKSISIEKTVKIYEKAGAKAISILTDKKYFDGNLDYIKEAKKFCSLPILRKDFIIDEYQIYESRAARADAVLLIASILEKKILTNFIKKIRFLNMTPIVEVHTRDDLKKALLSGTEIIGINTRDLKTFKINFSKVKSLIKNIPKDKFVIVESGIEDMDDLEKLKQLDRINGVLIGTGFMKRNEQEIIKFASDILNTFINEQ